MTVNGLNVDPAKLREAATYYDGVADTVRGRPRRAWPHGGRIRVVGTIVRRIAPSHG